MARRSQLASLLLGVALVATVAFVAVHFSEAREFTDLLERANPWWLLVALACQAATYFAQAEVFRGAPRIAGAPLPRRWLYQLSLTKLFLDQAVPSAGISSAMATTRALRQRGVPRDAAAASAIINLASYHAAYVVTLVTALVIASTLNDTNAAIIGISLLFVAFAVGLTVATLALAGRSTRATAALDRVPVVRGIVGFLEDANPELSRSPVLMTQATLWQTAIFVLDAATMWVLILAAGATAPPAPVYASFMIASVFRTVGIVPGGLGTYEAASVLTLRMIGVSIPVALSATLVFRGLSFWLPMLPGLWFSRRILAKEAIGSRASDVESYWTLDGAALAARLGSSLDGLAHADADERLQRVGPNRLRAAVTYTRARVLGSELRNPLLLILVFAAVASALSGEWLDATIVIVIVLASVGISYSREYSAHSAVAALQARVLTRTTVRRDGRTTSVPIEDVVPGDIVLLSAGSLVPGDGIVTAATDFFVSEAVLTGESFPVEKRPGIAAAESSLRDRSNCVFFGTNVRSGTASCLIARTGPATEFGAVAHRLALRPPETEFDRGIRRFGYLLTSAMLLLVFVVFAAHVLRGRPPVETLLFSVALAVGLSPELLPAILSVNLARGARLMAQHGVIVRRLNAIENLGSMDVLCTDKTGTITEGVVQMDAACDPGGTVSAEVLTLAALNAGLETGLSNPLDEAITRACSPDLTQIRKLAEIPFDFVRKRVSIVIGRNGSVVLITKGAFERVLDACTSVAGGRPLDDATRRCLAARYDEWTGRGMRVLAVATRQLEPQASYGRSDETDLTFAGFLTFFDRPKAGANATLAALSGLGVSVKVISGDSRRVGQYVARLVGLHADRVLTGREIQEMNDEALWHAAERIELFVEVDPNQKERIILALKKTGHVVGFLGDGVNDAPAMHAADTSLSVDQAVDVAREAADFVLLERDLDVIRRGIEEGRRTFANTMKYVLTTTSANLGNMISMAAASLVLPFLPLLAGQILLNNFLSDIPAIGLADDSVDPEMVARPERWNIRFIGRFMVVFGLLSSLFDAMTFVVLLRVFRTPPAVFRTAWFVESLLTELVIALVVRTRRPLFHSRPGRLLLVLTMLLTPVAFALPYLPFAGVLEFVPLPGPILVAISVITLLYVAAAEAAKRLRLDPGKI